MSKMKVPAGFPDQSVTSGVRHYPVKDGHIDVADAAVVAELTGRGFVEVPTDDAAQRAQQAQQAQQQQAQHAATTDHLSDKIAQSAQRNQPDPIQTKK